MGNLYELLGDYRDLEEALQDGKLGPNQVEALLDKIDEAKGPLREKVDNIVRLIRNFRSDVEGIKNEQRRLKARKSTLEGAQKRLRNWVRTSMDILDVKEIKTPLASVKFGTKQSVTVTVVDVAQVPEAYFKPREVDTTKVKQAYEADGEIVPGCEVETEPPGIIIR